MARASSTPTPKAGQCDVPALLGTALQRHAPPQSLPIGDGHWYCITDFATHTSVVIALSEPCCVFLVDDSKVYWQWFGPTRAGWQRKGSGPLFCFSIVAQRPRVSPPSRPGAVDGLLVPLAHGLMRTPCGEQKRHWYRIMDFATLTSGKAPSSTRAPSKAPCCSATLRRNSFR